MKAADIKAAFPSEADLCAVFIESLQAHGGWTIYPETAGFDMLCVYDKTGHQLGVEAKLALNAKVIEQILPQQYMGWGDHALPGPDFRAVVVPCITESNAGLAELLKIIGVKVFVPEQRYSYAAERTKWGFTFSRHGEVGGRAQHRAEYDVEDKSIPEYEMYWHDWNPIKRCELPEIVPMVRCGVPAPTQLTPWKIGALRVLAEIEVAGFITAKGVRNHGVDARRFCATDGWLTPLGEGRWGRGRVPAFDQQHPEAYAQVLGEARAKHAAAKAVSA